MHTFRSVCTRVHASIQVCVCVCVCTSAVLCDCVHVCVCLCIYVRWSNSPRVKAGPEGVVGNEEVTVMAAWQPVAMRGQRGISPHGNIN